MQGRKNVFHVIQGQYRISDDPTVELATVLGSCVAACMHDPVRKIGGMNHFLLPGSDPHADRNVKYGAHSMEELINALLRAGARRENLQVWLYGGANVVKGLGEIGAKNAQFARRFVVDERFRLMGTDLGGNLGRRVRFQPALGSVQHTSFPITDQSTAADLRPKPTPPRQSGTVELF